MKYAENYIRSSIAIIGLYQGDTPFAVFLKNYFSANKKFGSKDRKYITQICYNYFRLAPVIRQEDLAIGIKIALFICNESIGEWASLFDEYWQKNWSGKLADRVAFIQSNYASVASLSIFPFNHLLSKDINHHLFSLSHCIQPDLFIRVRPSKKEKVLDSLKAANCLFEIVQSNTIRLPNGTKLETIVTVDEDIVIQDLSSQRVGAMLEKIKTVNSINGFSVWDCCAASGGKSILAHDIFENIQLTVTDIRKSILHNLESRLNRAGVHPLNSFLIDLSKPIDFNKSINKNQFDLVICDAPCSGSGTWSRTPEQLSFFDEKKLAEFQQLQQQILTNILPSIKKGGYLLYITCSVFEKENELISQFVEAHLGAQLLEQKIIEGYTQKADTMFVALFQF
jgi:16S rRNA (cytosine967-C5)-methyltransferase